MSRLTPIRQRAATAVRRRGQLIVPNFPVLDASLGYVHVTSEQNNNHSQYPRGYDIRPMPFGSIAPAVVAGQKVSELATFDNGLVVLELEGMVPFNTTPPFGGIRAAVGEQFWEIEMAWNSTALRYESVQLHPDFYQALAFTQGQAAEQLPAPDPEAEE